MQKKYYRLVFLCSLFFPILTFASSHNNNACSKQDSAGVHAAIVKYIEKNSQMHSGDVEILKVQCSNQYASAIVHPKKPVTDDATVYLHKKKTWEVLSMGTDFDNDLLKQIPKNIRTY